MNCFFNKIIYFLNSVFSLRSQSNKQKEDLKNVKQYSIVSSCEVGIKVNVFKPETDEEVQLIPIFKGITRGSFHILFPEIDLWKFKDALVCDRSDFIIVNDKAIWNKPNSFNYIKNIVRDRFLVHEDDGMIQIKNAKSIKHVRIAFSLIGTHSHIWSHNISEYYPKLTQLEAVINENPDQTIYVLIPDYKDAQLKQVIYNEILQHPNCHPFVVCEDEAVMADILYFMDRIGFFTDHEEYVAIGDSLQPKIVTDIVKDKLVFPLISSVCTKEKNKKYEKLYLVRKSLYRNMINYDEIQKFFEEKGFTAIEPHMYTLDEKVRIFQNAKYLVGAYSSAFSNMMFCAPGTKSLIFTNYNRAFESWLTIYPQFFGIDVMMVTGMDIYQGNYAHCNYSIPLNKIIDACDKFGIPL